MVGPLRVDTAKSAAIATSLQSGISSPWFPGERPSQDDNGEGLSDRSVRCDHRENRGTVPVMSYAAPSRLRTSGFIAMVVAVTALVVMVMWAVTGSWATGGVVGGVSGGVSAALYPVLVRRVSN